MQKPCCKIELIVRTIGAERGRAARGRPEVGYPPSPLALSSKNGFHI
jgi:hypothetical protein